jgi:hypothetical protein
MVSIIASITRAAAAFGKSALAATASINSDLFTISPCFSKPVNVCHGGLLAALLSSNLEAKIVAKANYQDARGVPAAYNDHFIPSGRKSCQQKPP